MIHITIWLIAFVALAWANRRCSDVEEYSARAATTDLVPQSDIQHLWVMIEASSAHQMESKTE